MSAPGGPAPGPQQPAAPVPASPAPAPTAAAGPVPAPAPAALPTPGGTPVTSPAPATPAAGSRIDTRPPPIQPAPAQQTPVRRGLFNFFRKDATPPKAATPPPAPASGAATPASGGGTPQPAGAASPGEPEASQTPEKAGSQAGSQGGAAPAEGAQPPGEGEGAAKQEGLMQNTMEGKDPMQLALVSYENSYKFREELAAVTASILLVFELDRFFNTPAPLPARLTAMREGRTVREELGLYRERQCILNHRSLNKIEQRIAKAANLDRGLLAQMAGGDTEAAEQQLTIMAERQAEKDKQEEEKQLKLGALPTVTEEGEGAEGAAAEQAAPEVLQLPPAPGAEGAAAQSGTEGGATAAEGEPGAEGEPPVEAIPMPTPIMDPMYAYQWLDENGLMVYVPNPLKRVKERPARRYDQDKEMTRTYVRRPVVEATRSADEKLYRLDIELGRLEFLVHPAMAQEDLLAAQLLTLFREFKRREAVGLVMYYANRLAALEDSMLGAREKLFALQVAEGSKDDILDAYAMLAKIEREVAEIRQLKEEEEFLLSRTVRAMEKMYGEIVNVRQQQGYALTNLELTVLTKPPQEMSWRQGILTRERLDALLVASEMEEIAGLPKYPEVLPVPDLADLPLPRVTGPILGPRAPQPPPGFPGAPAGQAMPGFAQILGEEPLAPPPIPDNYVFRLRRCESMCAAHTALLAEATARLESLKNRPSADPEDPVLKEAEEDVLLLGRAPHRVAMSLEEQLALQRRAQEMIRANPPQVFVVRMPHLIPVLTIMTPEKQAEMQQQLQAGAQGTDLMLQPGQAAAPGTGPGADAAKQGQQAQGTGNVPVEPPPPAKPSHKNGGKGRYYVRLYVNGHFVDASGVTTLGDNFVGDLKDTFSVQVSRWPESICVQLFERNTLRDSFVAQAYVAVPGKFGTPHVDAQARPYQFTALSPFRARQPTAGTGPMPIMPELNVDPVLKYKAVFPAGIVYCRCGWVADRVLPGTRLADFVLPNATMTYDNPLAEREGDNNAIVRYDGRTADIEAGKDLMPPMPSIPVDRMLRRAAERIGGKANRTAIMRWLAEHVIDPNDPRNAPLLELLKTQEAAASALGELFRLDIFPDVAMREDRSSDKRMSVLARRWQTGIYRAPDKNLLKGVRSVPLRAPLNPDETEHLDNQYLDQLALLEQASDGTQLALARVMMARHEKAMQLQIGHLLTNAIKEREERIRAFGLRVRAASARLAEGRTMARRFRTEDVVNDAPLPQFKLELGAISQLLAPRRPLKRSRKLIKSLMTSVPRETQLVVTIQRASNLPARMAEPAGGGAAAAKSPEPGRKDAEEEGDKDRRLRRGPAGRRFRDEDDYMGGLPPPPDKGEDTRNCFVEVRFRSLAQRTVAVPGEFPLFNEQIELDVFRDDGRDQTQKGPEDGSGLEPSPSALQENSDLITFNVFDEIIREPRETANLRKRDGDEISDPVRLPERERRFLGCLRVPLSAVYQLQSLDGIFKLEVPPVILGYVQTSERPPTISVFLTMRPRLAAPAGEVDERITSGEQEQVNRHAQRWLAELLAKPQCRSRVLKVMAVDADGAAVLLCRYVSPTPLPPSIAQLVRDGGTAAAAGGVEALMLKLARFVAHVPYMEDVGLQKRRNDIWTTSSEFLHLTGGDFEEHAHLLLGYFQQLRLQCFLVMGTSICGARSMFVLTTGLSMPDPALPQEQQGHPTLNFNPHLLRLWNPITGSVVSCMDPTGELREVGQVYENTNIWANVQATGRPWEMKWNLEAAKEWQPFFGAQLPPREIASIQTTPLYEELDTRFYEELEGRVEKRVEESLSQARAAGAFVTRPDNKVSRLLKTLLKEMPKAHEAIGLASLAASDALAETAGKGPTEAPQYLGERHKLIAGLQAMHNERIRKESRAEAAHGHVLALPFSDRYLEAVSDSVLNTGIHRIADERVKYSTAVFVEPLGASFVCCIWIYVAAIRG
ncbi:hypothetical protein HYH03_017082 [Edaphochlamys debaryana]|uniref:C2 domain-containing protein n=1 Tax=Edaphochlamys debaryana TaxID=47281 RepID=A0A836BPL6_9CHLO|nr:hypothetical protein HYH03_017082 [Edaphochlamys debaryana]|eukprot:KAG2484062.1 hypothetical protein HYH03_017082 [Edaphochlamys debaryana]